MANSIGWMALFAQNVAARYREWAQRSPAQAMSEAWVCEANRR